MARIRQRRGDTGPLIALALIAPLLLIALSLAVESPLGDGGLLVAGLALALAAVAAWVATARSRG